MANFSGRWFIQFPICLQSRRCLVYIPRNVSARVARVPICFCLATLSLIRRPAVSNKSVRSHWYNDSLTDIDWFTSSHSQQTSLETSLLRMLLSRALYEVCSENNENFLISRVWRVLLSKFLFIMLVYMPLKYHKIFSCIHCLLYLWQPLRLDVFLWARRFSFVKRNGSKNLY